MRMTSISAATLAAAVLALAAVPASAQPSAPMIKADDQTAMGRTVTIGSVMIPSDGFVVVHTVKDGKVLAPQSIGHTMVRAGSTKDVKVELEYAPRAGEDYVAMLHEDTGQKGKYEFGPGMTDVDLPVMKDSKPVVDGFKITP